MKVVFIGIIGKNTNASLFYAYFKIIKIIITQNRQNIIKYANSVLYGILPEPKGKNIYLL